MSLKKISFIVLSFAFVFLGNAQKKSSKTNYYKSKNKTSSQKGSYGNQESLRQKEQQAITSSFHANNIGKIVFSNAIVQKSNPSSNLKTTFRITDRIYGRVFLDKSPQNTPLYFDDGRLTDCSICTIKYVVYVNGEKQNQVLENKALLDSDENKWTTRQVWLNPEPIDDPADPAWVTIVNSLPAGSHDIRIEYFVTGGTNVSAKSASAVGEFTLLKKSGEKLKIGKDWSSLRRGLNDKSLESLLVKRANSEYELTQNGSKYLKAKVYANGWTIVRNRLSGVPEYRWIEVYFLEKKKDGSCYAQTFPVTQQYDGNKYVNTQIQLGAVYSLKASFNGYIDCQ